MRLIRVFKFINNNRNAAPVQESELSFCITNDYPEKALEKATNYKIIGAKGKQIIYAIIPEASSSEMKSAAILKANVVERIVKENLGSLGMKESIARTYNLASNLSSNNFLSYLVAHDVGGAGAFSILLEDSKNIEEIMVDTPASNIALYHVKYGYCTTNLKFKGEQQLRFAANRLIDSTERELSENSPIIDAQLEDGSRLHAQLRPYASNGALVSIRLNGSKSIDLKRLLELNTLNTETAAYTWMALETKCNIIIAGAPSSGKTTMLLALNALVPRYERIVTIEEDINELKFYSNFVNTVSLQASKSHVDVAAQVVNALHIRPDRLIIGEVRGKETREAFSGANVGVPFITTLHASANGNSIIDRLSSKPMNVEPQLICMLDLSFYMNHSSLNSRRLDSIVEYKWLVRGEIKPDSTGELFKTVEIASNGTLGQVELKRSKVIQRYAKSSNISTSEAINELKKRASFLNDISAFDGSAIDYIGKYDEIK